MKAALQGSTVGYNIPDEVIMELLEKADSNRDGVIQRQEFMDVVRRGQGGREVEGTIENVHTRVMNN